MTRGAWILLCMLSGAGVALADEIDVRVLVKFDTGGHQLAKVLFLQSPPGAARLSTVAPADASQRAPGNPAHAIARQYARDQSATLVPAPVVPGVDAELASLTWLDANGAVISSSTLADPRVMHAPLVAGQPHLVHYSVRTSGVYRLTGPPQSAELRVGLPVIIIHGRLLPAEQWAFKLR